MGVILATSCDEKFYPQAKRYLESIEKFWPWRAVLICVDWKPPFEQAYGVEHVPFKTPPGSITKHGCVQHGAFIDAIPGDDDDVFVFTDADVELQRAPTSDVPLMNTSVTVREPDGKCSEAPIIFGERQSFAAWPDSSIGMGHAMSTMGTTLEEQIKHNQHPKLPLDEIKAIFPGLEDRVSYVAGCMIGRRSAFQWLKEQFLARYRDVERCLGHHSRTQWLLSYLLQEPFQDQYRRESQRCHAMPIPYTFHVANKLHPKLPEGCHFDDGHVCYKGNVVLFRHGTAWQKTLEWYRQHNPELVR